MEQTELTNTLPVEATAEVPAMVDPLQSAGNFELLQRYGKMYAASQLVPDRFKNKLADCVIAVEMSRMLQVHPLYLMKNLYIVQGKPAIQGELAIALVNSRGGYTHKLRFEWLGEKGKDSWGCRCWATEKDGTIAYGPEVTIAMAKAEGWVSKNPKWTNMPELMLMYRAGAFFARPHCAHVLGGLPLVEEIEDIGGATTKGQSAERLTKKLKG